MSGCVLHEMTGSIQGVCTLKRRERRRFIGEFKAFLVCNWNRAKVGEGED